MDLQEIAVPRANDKLAAILASFCDGDPEDKCCRFPRLETLLDFLPSDKRASILRACSVTVPELCRRGAGTPVDFRKLGFDALDLACFPAEFCESLVERFGATEVERAFIILPGDCVAVCGSPAQEVLKLDLQRIVDICCGFSLQSNASLELYLGRWASVAPRTVKGIRMQSPLGRVSARSLLCAGVNFSMCSSIVRSMACDVDSTGLNAKELCALGLPSVSFGGMLQ